MFSLRKGKLEQPENMYMKYREATGKTWRTKSEPTKPGANMATVRRPCDIFLGYPFWLLLSMLFGFRQVKSCQLGQCLILSQTCLFEQDLAADFYLKLRINIIPIHG